MNKPKHTPGPWRVKRSTHFAQNDIKEYFWVGFGPIGDETPIFKKDLTENEANARLIAAAPELLEACLAIFNRDIDDPDGYDKAFDLVRSAIAKATGGEE